MIIQAETWMQAAEQIYTDRLKTACRADTEDSTLCLCVCVSVWGVYFTGLCLFWWSVSPFISWVCMPQNQVSVHQNGKFELQRFLKKLLFHLLDSFWTMEIFKLGLCSTSLLRVKPVYRGNRKSLIIFSMMIVGQIHPPHTGSNLCQQATSLENSHSVVSLPEKGATHAAARWIVKSYKGKPKNQSLTVN